MNFSLLKVLVISLEYLESNVTVNSSVREIKNWQNSVIFFHDERDYFCPFYHW